MKVLIAYPPLVTPKGYPTIGQNRQFQYFKEPTFIYPVVPAQAATLLKAQGHEVIWLDCLAQGLDEPAFLRILKQEKPEVILFETKTPVIPLLWKYVNIIKELGLSAHAVLCGDHVTALPEESFGKCKVDYVLTGGDYDFLLANLCAHLKDPAVTPLEPGIYYRRGREVLSTGAFRLDHDLNTLPFIDRKLTRWQDYAYKNGNFKRTPGTYVMAGRDCWWGKCTFCSWPTLYPTFRSRTPENCLDEIGILVRDLKVREIMDDSGCFPAGKWLEEYCRGMISRGLHRKVYLDCNMRFGALGKEEFRMMKKANFRLLLFGLESANQGTLDKINKNVDLGRVVEDCRNATRAGLYPHITLMFGYPWESYEDACRTMELGKYLLKKGLAYTMQATVVIPYPGTRLFEECRKKGLLATQEWEEYDMKRQVMKTSIPDADLFRLVQGMYGVSFDPEFVIRKLFALRDPDDLKYALRAVRKVFGHLLDFRKK